MISVIGIARALGAAMWPFGHCPPLGPLAGSPDWVLEDFLKPSVDTSTIDSAFLSNELPESQSEVDTSWDDESEVGGVHEVTQEDWEAYRAIKQRNEAFWAIVAQLEAKE
jgi:hypothetical protein